MLENVQKLASESLAWSMMPLEQWALWSDSSRKTLDQWVSHSLKDQDEMLAWVRQSATSTQAPAPSKPKAAKPKAAKPAVVAEPVVEAAPIEAEVVEPEAIEPVVAEADDLTRISGVGPALAKKLAAAGYTTFSQIAQLSDADIETLEGTVIRFSGRIQRDGWKQQAAELMTAE